MEKENVRRFRTAAFVGLMIWLGAMAVMLGILIFLMTDALNGANAAGRKLLGRMLWLCSSVLALTGLMMLWVVIRYIKFRLHPLIDSRPTPYVDAWAEAGRRFQLPENGGNDEKGESRRRESPPGGNQSPDV